MFNCVEGKTCATLQRRPCPDVTCPDAECPEHTAENCVIHTSRCQALLEAASKDVEYIQCEHVNKTGYILQLEEAQIQELEKIQDKHQNNDKLDELKDKYTFLHVGYQCL